jgi:hypothetical protein
VLPLSLPAHVPLIVGNVRDEFRSFSQPQTDAELPATMVFDVTSRVEYDPVGAALRLMSGGPA